MHVNHMQIQEQHDQAGATPVNQDMAGKSNADVTSGPCVCGGGGHTVCLIRSRANWRRRSCSAARLSRKRLASKQVLRRLLLLRAVNCVPLTSFVVQLLAPDHFASQLGMEGVTDVGLHTQRGAWQNGALKECPPRIRPRRVPEKLQLLAVVVVKPRTDLVMRRHRAEGSHGVSCRTFRVACDGTLQRTAWHNAGRGTHRLRDLARNCGPCRPPVLEVPPASGSRTAARDGW